MLDYIRSLIAEVLPAQPKPRRFKRRNLSDRSNSDTNPEGTELREAASFGRRGSERSTPKRKR